MNKITLRQAIAHFLQEDIGYGDITTEAIFTPDQQGKAQFIANHPFVSAGMEKIAGEVFTFLHPEIKIQGVEDGVK